MAAALRELLSREPIIVGGTAEEYWTADDYHETDLDLCAPLGRGDQEILAKVGFRLQGRHWIRKDIHVAVEFPDSSIAGELERTVLVTAGKGKARVIGVDDLYLDRLRQATMHEAVEGIEFHSALAVAAACFEQIDWGYVKREVMTTKKVEPLVGESMSRLDSKIRRRVRRKAEE